MRAVSMPARGPSPGSRSAATFTPGNQVRAAGSFATTS
jgi:hypothetical protein